MINERRQFLAVGAAFSAVGILPGCAGASAADASPPPLPYPDIADASSATPELASFMKAFFAAKTRRDVDATMAFFSPDLITYTDVTVGIQSGGWTALKALLAHFMSQWPATSMSYPTRIIGDMNSALIAFTDTPEQFGGEIHALGTLDFKDGKILRWFDHWDARGWPNSFGIPKLLLSVPTDYRVADVGERADPKLQQAAKSLITAMSSGNAAAATALFSVDAIYEDMALRTQVQGRLAIGRYLSRSLALLPQGLGSTFCHAVGDSHGGALEWYGAETTLVKAGATAIVLDASGFITRATAVYDSALLTSAQITQLISLGIDP